MFWAWLAVSVTAGYLCGSVSFAILVTRIRTGNDIRQLGNRNPGTANVGRSLGRGWGALVLLGDVLKCLLPMLAGRALFFSGSDAAAILAVYSIGWAAMAGHCRPVFYGFRGGGGIAVSLPIYFFFVPVEFALSIAAGGLVTFLFVRNVSFRVGRWLPMIFITIAPFLTLAATLTVSVPLGRVARIGGHPWSVLVGVFATTLVLWAFNLRLIVASLSNPQAPIERH
jgi:acyl-phosphate glycerol 3-phosphate acyltransferase